MKIPSEINLPLNHAKLYIHNTVKYLVTVTYFMSSFNSTFKKYRCPEKNKAEQKENMERIKAELWEKFSVRAFEVRQGCGTTNNGPMIRKMDSCLQ